MFQKTSIKCSNKSKYLLFFSYSGKFDIELNENKGKGEKRWKNTKLLRTSQNEQEETSI